GTVGNISINHNIHSLLHRVSFLDERPDHSLRISGPVSFFSHLEIVQRRFDHAQMLEIHRIKSELSVLPLSRRHIGTDGQRTGEYMTSVVVGVLSDQIHTSRSKIGADIPLPSEMLCKTLQYFLLHPLLLSEPCSIFEHPFANVSPIPIATASLPLSNTRYALFTESSTFCTPAASQPTERLPFLIL